LRPTAFGGVEHAAEPADRSRSALRPPPPPQPSTFSASAHVTGPPARHRPRRRPTASGRVPTWRLVAPFSRIDAAQQAQQGHQLRNLPATIRAIGKMAVERGTLRFHETADQVGAQREADVVILPAHHVTAPRKTSDRTTCPLTVPGVVRFTVIPACGPGHRHRSRHPEQSKRAVDARGLATPPGSSGDRSEISAESSPHPGSRKAGMSNSSTYQTKRTSSTER
jgi:hypothetical protein